MRGEEEPEYPQSRPLQSVWLSPPSFLWMGTFPFSRSSPAHAHKIHARCQKQSQDTARERNHAVSVAARLWTHVAGLRKKGAPTAISKSLTMGACMNKARLMTFVK